MDKVVNEAIVNKVAAALPEEEILYDVAELFKVFGDSTRIRIICALFESEMCVYDLAAVFRYDTVCYFTPIKNFKASKPS